MSRRDYEDDDYSDYDSRREGFIARPQRSEREPDLRDDGVRRRPQPPPSRRSRETYEDVEERRPPVNRDSQDRRPPPGRGDHENYDRDREQSRSASRDRPVERAVRESPKGGDYIDDGDVNRSQDRRRQPPRGVRESYDGRGDSHDRTDSRDRGDIYYRRESREREGSRDRRDSRERYDDFNRRESRDRGSSRDRRGDSRERYRDDDDDDDDRYKNVRSSRDRNVRSSREGPDPRRSREAPKGFTPRSYSRPNGTPPASAWSSDGHNSLRQFEKENRPIDRESDSWTSAVKHRPPPTSSRGNYRGGDDSDEEYDRRGQIRRDDSTRVNRHISRDNFNHDQSHNRDSRFTDGRDVNVYHDSRDRGGYRYNERDRDGDRSRPPQGGHGHREEFDIEDSQDNDIRAFSVEKPKRPDAPRRQHSPDYEIARRLDDENGDRRGEDRSDSRGRRDDSKRDGAGRSARNDSRDGRGYEHDYDEDQRVFRGDRGNGIDKRSDRDRDDRTQEDRSRESDGGTVGTGRKWEEGGDDGITVNDMKRLEDFRKSGRYSSGNEKETIKSGSVYNFKPSGNVPLVNYCPPNGGHTDLFQCYIVRERTSISSKLYPTYKLYSQEGDKLLILARKMSMNSTSNYHLFDMTRGIPEKANLSKKSGNYIGKLRGIDSNHSEYVVVTKSEDKHEIAAIQFDRLGLVSQLKEGCQPRKMNILLPRISSDNEPIPHSLKHTDSSKKKPKSLATHLRKNDFGNFFNLVSKDPIYENGNYRLNFHGRVSIPSVKNFQLTTPDDIDDVICQFGKIADETFNLDFKYPLNPFQAFSLALCHFDA